MALVRLCESLGERCAVVGPWAFWAHGVRANCRMCAAVPQVAVPARPTGGQGSGWASLLAEEDGPLPLPLGEVLAHVRGERELPVPCPELLLAWRLREGQARALEQEEWDDAVALVAGRHAGFRAPRLLSRWLIPDDWLRLYREGMGRVGRVQWPSQARPARAIESFEGGYWGLVWDVAEIEGRPPVTPAMAMAAIGR